MRIAGGNEQSVSDMESSDCCAQSGRDMLPVITFTVKRGLFQNWFNLTFAGFPKPVGPKVTLLCSSG